VDAHGNRNWGLNDPLIDTTAFRLYTNGEATAQAERAIGTFPCHPTPDSQSSESLSLSVVPTAHSTSGEGDAMYERPAARLIRDTDGVAPDGLIVCYLRQLDTEIRAGNFPEGTSSSRSLLAQTEPEWSQRRVDVPRRS
jgi:hypothetical protein